MAHVIPRLPDAQIAALSAGYRAEMAAKRRMTLGGLVILLLLAALAGMVAEVDIRLLIANIDKFTSYFGGCSSSTRAPPSSPTSANGSGACRNGPASSSTRC